MLKKFLVCLALAVIVTGCSSGGTNTSIGLNLTGQWSGVIRSNNTGQAATMTLSLTQAAESSDVTGVATFGAGACMSGAAVTGSVAGSGINLEVTSASSTLTMGGQFTAENAISGTWFNTAEQVSEPSPEAPAGGGVVAPSGSDPVADPSTDPAATKSRHVMNTACADEAGTWSLGRR